MKMMPTRKFLYMLVAIVAVGAILRLGWIGSQAPTGDDVMVAVTATNYVANGQPNPTEPFHPVLRNLLVYASMMVFGGSPLGVKGFSLLLGTLLVGVTGLFVRRAARDERAGLFAAGLVALDIVQIDYSRQAIQEVHTAFFAMVGAWLVVEALRAEDTRSWRWLLPLAGVSYGLGVASKFYALSTLVLSIGLLLASSWKRRKYDEVLLTGAALVPLPFTVYLLTYVPWFRRGYGIAEWVTFQRATMSAMTTHTKAPVAYLAYNKAAMWFLQPFYGYADVATTAAGQMQLSVAVGNPLVWLAVVPATLYAVIVPGQRRRDAILLAYFATAYLPLVLSSRPIWMLSSVAVFPFAAGVLGSVAAALTRRASRRVVWAYVAVVIATSLLLYPLAIGRALRFPYLQPIVARMGDYVNAQGAAQ